MRRRISGDSLSRASIATGCPFFTAGSTRVRNSCQNSSTPDGMSMVSLTGRPPMVTGAASSTDRDSIDTCRSLVRRARAATSRTT